MHMTSQKGAPVVLGVKRGTPRAECIDRESCDTRVKGHPKEFHVNRRSRKSSKK